LAFRGIENQNPTGNPGHDKITYLRQLFKSI
jgi:hypothetical protein